MTNYISLERSKTPKLDIVPLFVLKKNDVGAVID